MIKNNKKLAVITIHKGNIKNLKKTVRSVDMQEIFPDLHLLIIHHIGYNHSKIFKKKNRRIIISKDKSLFHAMNIALKKTFDYNIIFLNSGDEFYDFKVVKFIKSNLRYSKCLIFKTCLVDKKSFYLPKKKFFENINYSPHPSFIRPPVQKKIYYQENPPMLADGKWMLDHRKYIGTKKINILTSKFYLTGTSTYPSFRSIKLQFNYNFKEGFKESVKFILSKIFKKNYYKIIYKNKFLKNRI